MAGCNECTGISLHMTLRTLLFYTFSALAVGCSRSVPSAHLLAGKVREVVRKELLHRREEGPDACCKRRGTARAR
eukprot:6142111-Pleurochrysis_carterae.AAC.1